jgi:hypothetical protein
MRPALHIALSLPAAATAAHYSGPVAAALFVTGAILIDIDHLIMYFQRTGDLHPIRLLRWFEEVDRRLRPGEYLGLCIFHTVEFFTLLALLSIFEPSCWWFFAGSVFHIVLDAIGMILHPVYGVRVRAHSLIEHLNRRKKENSFWERMGSNASALSADAEIKQCLSNRNLSTLQGGSNRHDLLSRKDIYEQT